jgi:MAE_28990/MAE_18760-like HEPN
MIEDQFRARMTGVRYYLRSLRELEKAHKTPGRGFYRASATLAASRAAAFIMIYNCVEYATRESVAAVRKKMQTSSTDFGQIVEFWQEEIIWTHFKEKLEDGINHATLLKNFRDFVPGKVTWLKHGDRVPFPGNIDHEKLIRLARDIGDRRWRPPKNTLGGSDLANIKKARNELAHGEDTFEAVGGNYSVADISDKVDRVRLFMCSYIRMMERYQNNETYKIN